MKLVAAIKLRPTREQATVLRATLKRCNEACTAIAAKGFAAGVLRQFDLQKLAYVETRTEFGLTAQAAVRCISKVADAFKINRKVAPVFRADAAQPYDDRILSFKGEDVVSIWTLEGRMKIGYVAGQKQRDLLAFRKGEVDLCFVRGKWLLAAHATFQRLRSSRRPTGLASILGSSRSPPPATVKSILARPSSGPAPIAKRRKGLQSKGTKAAKRRLVKLSGKQGRFQKHVNHGISKAIVIDAERTGRGIAVEELTHIRKRVTARRKDRARLSNWSFGQLRSFLAYKASARAFRLPLSIPPTRARLLGCGLIDKRNRPNQATFSCVSCGHSEAADLNAARNIRARATLTTLESSQACVA